METTQQEEPVEVAAEVEVEQPLMTETVPNHLVYAILVTICCCLPFGIVSIIQAAKVNSLVAAGDIDAAWEASEQAKKWATIGLVIGIVVNLIVMAIQLLAVMAEM